VLDSLVNTEHIRKYITSLQKRVKRHQREGKDVKKFLTNYVFVGAPGTGKTTVARAFGEIFHELGLVSSPLVVECKAMELIGEYVGQSAAKMRYPFISYHLYTYASFKLLLIVIPSTSLMHID
jgi:stage V sporulation protein K